MNRPVNDKQFLVNIVSNEYAATILSGKLTRKRRNVGVNYTWWSRSRIREWRTV